MKTKGQLFSGDIAIATMVFLSALSLAFFLWNSITEDINRAENLRELEKLASETVEQLIRTPGIPRDWNYYTVEVPGLASSDRIINRTKALIFIELMNSTHYSSNVHKMGLGRYDFYLNVTDLQDDVIQIGGMGFTTGKEPFDETESIAMFRTAIFNESIVRVNFIIWRGL
jgi:hypothetical protein